MFCIQNSSDPVFSYDDDTVLSNAEEFSVNESLVLIVGKEAESRLLYKTLFEMWNYQIAEMGNFDDFTASGGSGNLTLILLDCVLPFEENLKIIRKIRSDEVFRQIPIVAVSGYSQPIVRHLVLENGADDFLVKPLDFDELKTSLQKNIQKYRRRQSH